jgi:hypothetical protein
VSLVVCAPRAFTYRAILRCRRCKRRTRHLVSLFVWYEPTIRCLAHEVRVPGSYRKDPRRAMALWVAAGTREQAREAVLAAAMAEIEDR